MSYYAKRFFGQQQGIVTDGLKLWLDASNPASYPGTGTTWFDLSGNGNNGTMVNGVTYSAANGGVMSFDGVNDYVNAGDLGTLYVNGTISFWMKSTAVENYRNVFTTKHLGGNDAIRFEQYTTTSPHTGFNAIISNSILFFSYAPTEVLTPNYWYNVVLTWNTSTKQVVGYLNNIKKFDSICNAFPSTMPSITIGGGFNGGRYFKGDVSNVMIYNKALTPSEVLQNFNATRAKYNI